MRNIRLISFLAFSLFLSGLSHAECFKDHRANKTSGVLVKDVNILGTQTVGSDELSSITSELIGSCFNDDSGDIGEEILNSFYNRGYFTASIKNVHVKADDPLSVPKPVAIEA
jgi:outer membrane protein assembly factor BamA